MCNPSDPTLVSKPCVARTYIHTSVRPSVRTYTFYRETVTAANILIERRSPRRIIVQSVCTKHGPAGTNYDSRPAELWLRPAPPPYCASLSQGAARPQMTTCALSTGTSRSWAHAMSCASQVRSARGLFAHLARQRGAATWWRHAGRAAGCCGRHAGCCHPPRAMEVKLAGDVWCLGAA